MCTTALSPLCPFALQTTSPTSSPSHSAIQTLSTFNTTSSSVSPLPLSVRRSTAPPQDKCAHTCLTSLFPSLQFPSCVSFALGLPFLAFCSFSFGSCLSHDTYCYITIHYIARSPHSPHQGGVLESVDHAEVTMCSLGFT